ncbi:small GTP-binding domain protein [Nitzschia inconspicua]|uniref:Small GTP-binding domain protein n=1 Tax=Nitzschia inconspicua TaxID=303405 RepID=A0A9K3M4J0_9STRA|nr:small GTP-binding domain protein [Nitzschia inconspicua]
MEANGNNVQSSKNESNTPSIKIQKTRNILTALTPWKSPFKIDAEDYENIQEILRLKISDDAPLSYAVCELAAIDPYTDQYRVEGLRLLDHSNTETFWYTQPQLPNSLRNLDALTEIEICGTQIETLFSEDDDADYPKVIPNLRILKLESMPRLQCLPSNLGSFTKLKKLTLTGLLIDALPDSLSSLGGSLKAVVIRDCENLTHLPDGFGQLHSLKRFVTYKTPIQHLPDNFGNLTNLEELEMEFHHLTQLPPGYTNLTNLHTLDTGTVAFNFPVPHLPNLDYVISSVYKIHQFAQTPNVTELDMSYYCDNDTHASVLDLDLMHLSTWSNLVTYDPSIYRTADEGEKATPRASTVHGHPNVSIQDPSVIVTSKGRTSKPPDWHRNFTALPAQIDPLEQHKYQETDQLKELEDPIVFAASTNPDIMYRHEAMQEPDAPQFREAMVKEVIDHLKNRHFVVIPRSQVPGNLCTSWFPHLKKLQSLSVNKCPIANIRPDHFQHLGETNVCSIDLKDNPIVHGSDVPSRVAYHLCLNSARHLFLIGKRRIIAKGLWAFIFEKAVEATRGGTYYNKTQWSQAQAIYGLLKEFAVTEICG